MRTRRGSTYWTTSLSGHLKSFQKGDLVTAVVVDHGDFIGIVRDVNKKTNKVMVAWGGGSLVQHDPDEIMLSLHQDEIVKSRMASRRGLMATSVEQAEADPQFVGDPKIHGLDTPRGGGFSIMQNLQEDLVKEEKAEIAQDSIHPKVADIHASELRSRRKGSKRQDAKVAGRKVKYKDYVIEKSGENYYVTDPSGSRAFGETPASIATAKKWIDYEIHERRKKGSSELKSRRAMYHCGPDRTYRLTKTEQEAGGANCPKCRAPMEQHKFIRGNDILMCEGCGFKVTKNKLVTEKLVTENLEPVVEAVPSPEAVVAEVTTTKLQSRRDVAKGQWPLS